MVFDFFAKLGIVEFVGMVARRSSDLASGSLVHVLFVKKGFLTSIPVSRKYFNWQGFIFTKS